MIATSGFLTAIECTKFVFGQGFARTPLGSLQRSPDPLAGLRGNILLRERDWREGREERRGCAP